MGKLIAFTGLIYPLRTVKLFLRFPILWTYIAFPLVLNIGLGIFFYWQFFRLEQVMLTNFILQSQSWWHDFYLTLPSALGFLEVVVAWSFTIFEFLIKVLILILTGFILSQVGVLLGSPWYGALSEKIEFLQLGKAYTQKIDLVLEIRRSLSFELKKIMIFMGIGIPGFCFNFVPGFGSLMATVIGLSLTTTLTCLDFLDQPLERRRLSFRAKLGMIAKSLPSSAGFGFFCLILVSIPLVNLVTIPLCVAAGTLFFCDRLYPRYFVE